MCGPPDFEALHTCVTRLVELSAAGFATYSVCRAASLACALRRRREQRDEKTLLDLPGRLAAEGSRGHADA